MAEILFDKQEALSRLGDNEDLLKSVIEMYFHDYSSIFENILNEFNQGQKESPLRNLHTMKSVTGNLGLTALFKQIASTEQHIKTNGFQDAHKQELKNLQKLNEETIGELKKKLGY